MPCVIVTAIFSPPSVSRDRESRHFFWRDFTRPRDLDIRLVYYLTIFIFILVKSLQWWMLTFKLFWYPKSNLSDQLHQKLWMASYFNSLGISKALTSASILENNWKKPRKYSVCQSRESRGIFDETETRKMGPRRDQSRGLESRLQALMCNVYAVCR